MTTRHLNPICVLLRTCLLAVVLVVQLGCTVWPGNTGVQIRTPVAHQMSAGSIGRVLVLEPQIDYTLRSFSYDPLALPAESARIRDQLQANLSDSLQSRGLDVVAITDTAGQSDTRFLSRRLLGNYQRLMGLRNFSDDPLPSLGPGVNRLTSPAKSDYLLLSRYSGTQKSRGQQGKEVITASMRALISLGTQQYRVTPARYGELEVALVDGVSGQVLWSGLTTGQPEQLATMTEGVLRTMAVIDF